MNAALLLGYISDPGADAHFYPQFQTYEDWLLNESDDELR
jgi:hypothetical protein